MKRTIAISVVPLLILFGLANLAAFVRSGSEASDEGFSPSNSELVSDASPSELERAAEAPLVDWVPNDDKRGWNPETPVSLVLKALGGWTRNERPELYDDKMAKMGKEIIEQGWTIGPDGKRSRKQSRHFRCTSCHNMAQEDPDLSKSDPEVRLDYILDNGLPLLQGTTMYGTMNKNSWYNGDYYKKYGDLVRPANESIDEAIQLCAQVCSQGRKLEAWEMEAVKMYFWTLELRLGDLNLTEEEWKILKSQQGKGADKGMADGLQKKYLQASLATFVYEPEDKAKGFSEYQGDAARGKLIYSKACLACHNQQGPSNYLKLDHSNLSLSKFRRNIDKDNRFSIYEIVRHGTTPFAGHKAYMPHYPAERMSNAQVEDLRAYLEQGN